MLLARIDGIDRLVSRVVIGCELHDGTPVWDRFIEAGGSLFDTSHAWHDGASERGLGDWVARRGLEREVVVMVKGGHPPNCRPQALGNELSGSLDRLRLAKADIYFLHRDDVEVPVDEFVDALDELADAGLVRVLGASNWTIQRFAAANAYAARRGRRGFHLLSNFFSLADPPLSLGNGLVSACQGDSIEFLAATRTPHFAWSSQACGYFYDANSGTAGSALRARFDSPDNRERRRRAAELGSGLGVGAGHIATAYVLNQRFSSFAIVGARTADQVTDVVRGAEIELGPEQLEWLDLGRRRASHQSTARAE